MKDKYIVVKKGLELQVYIQAGKIIKMMTKGSLDTQYIVIRVLKSRLKLDGNKSFVDNALYEMDMYDFNKHYDLVNSESKILAVLL